jgi:hypothetical protein
LPENILALSAQNISIVAEAISFLETQGFALSRQADRLRRVTLAHELAEKRVSVLQRDIDNARAWYRSHRLELPEAAP